MINTVLGMVIDTDTMRPHLAGVTGGLSGPAIRPVAVRCIWQIRQAFRDLPIIGMGGVRSGNDALELVLAGAARPELDVVLHLAPRHLARDEVLHLAQALEHAEVEVTSEHEGGVKRKANASGTR